ncbi:non-homologous end-joining DNA ligase [Paeniglutamicibacter antarcticus]|uniref:Non-homologous end-joining DNA ligase n=1 Tax=Arthrobacter terrae TaxID=2935737 RepID=A0A931CRR0_9MICC|nr:non-homologous end-joining DNA ligase [Arthrobacter terrae]MBG0740991.1 non-homologous end-joining DNA ligase [Arthrobacter terrae]
MASEAVILPVGGPHGEREVRISNPQRILWPEPGISKLDLANYVVAVGEAFVAANGDRPVSLQRFPEGIDGEQFFSKNPPKGAPEFVRSVMVIYPSARSHPQLVIDEPAAAVWAVQMNTVVFHPWASRAENSNNPDELRIDLDPQPGTDFDDAVPVALELKSVLAEAGLTAYVKTSGNRGLHIFAPIEPVHEFLEVRHAVIAAARELERRMPGKVTTAWWKEERGQRIFVDFNQANRDRTMAGAYSPRALAHAPVSCPLQWDELETANPRNYTIATVPARLKKAADPWADMHANPGSIADLLSWWDRDVAAGLGELPFPPDYPKMPGEPPRVQPSRARKPDAPGKAGAKLS